MNFKPRLIKVVEGHYTLVKGTIQQILMIINVFTQLHKTNNKDIIKSDVH